MRQMRELFAKCQQFSAKHNELMKQWERLKARVDEIDGTQDRKRLPMNEFPASPVARFHVAEKTRSPHSSVCGVPTPRARVGTDCIIEPAV